MGVNGHSFIPNVKNLTSYELRELNQILEVISI